MSKPGLGEALTVASHEGGHRERLPFRIGVATAADMESVAVLRASAYGRHLPALGKRLEEPEDADFEPGCEVIVATSKLDGSVLGTMRIHSNVFRPLPLEASLALPGYYAGSRLAEATRLSILGSPTSSLVRSALFKAFYAYCAEQQIDWMLAAGRRPVDRLYDALKFTDVHEAGRYYPMAHASGVPHRVMSLATESVEPVWMQVSHSLYQFFFLTEHPDIDLSGARDLSALKSSPVTALPGHLNLTARTSPMFSKPVLTPRIDGASL